MLVLEMRIMDFIFFMQMTAYEVRIRDWSSDVCSSDLRCLGRHQSLAIGIMAESRARRFALGNPGGQLGRWLSYRHHAGGALHLPGSADLAKVDAGHRLPGRPYYFFHVFGRDLRSAGAWRLFACFRL